MVTLPHHNRQHFSYFLLGHCFGLVASMRPGLVPPCLMIPCRVPVRVSHVAIGESSKELAKPNLWILAILAKSINISFVAQN